MLKWAITLQLYQVCIEILVIFCASLKNILPRGRYYLLLITGIQRLRLNFHRTFQYIRALERNVVVLCCGNVRAPCACSAQVLFDQPADTTDRPTEPKSHAAALRLSQTFEKVLLLQQPPPSSDPPTRAAARERLRTTDGYVDPGSNPQKHFLGLHTQAKSSIMFLRVDLIGKKLAFIGLGAKDPFEL